MRRLAPLALLLSAGCYSIPSEAQRTNLLNRLDNCEREAETPGSRSPEQLARLRAEHADVRATVNSACLGEPVK